MTPMQQLLQNMTSAAPKERPISSTSPVVRAWEGERLWRVSWYREFLMSLPKWAILCWISRGPNVLADKEAALKSIAGELPLQERCKKKSKRRALTQKFWNSRREILGKSTPLVLSMQSKKTILMRGQFGANLR